MWLHAWDASHHHNIHPEGERPREQEHDARAYPRPPSSRRYGAGTKDARLPGMQRDVAALCRAGRLGMLEDEHSAAKYAPRDARSPCPPASCRAQSASKLAHYTQRHMPCGESIVQTTHIARESGV